MKIFSRHISKPTGSGADLVGVPPKESERFLSDSLTAPDQAFFRPFEKTQRIAKNGKNYPHIDQNKWDNKENTLKWLKT